MNLIVRISLSHINMKIVQSCKPCKIDPSNAGIYNTRSSMLAIFCSFELLVQLVIIVNVIWWLIRATLVVDWRFLPQNFGQVVGTYKGLLMRWKLYFQVVGTPQHYMS